MFLKGLFSAQEKGYYQWVDDPKLTEITITDQHPVNPEVLEKRPAIITLRGNAQWAVVGRDQMVNYEWHTGKKTKMDIVSFMMTFACLSREGIEAQRLAWFIFSMLPLFRGHLQRSIPGMHDVGLRMTLTGETAAGALVQGSSFPEWKMVQVMSPIQMSYMSSIEPLDKAYLGKIEATIHNLAGTINQQARIDE